MFRATYHLPGTSPATLSPPVDTSPLPPRLRYTLFDKEQLEEREVASIPDIPPHNPDGPVLWIELDGLSNIEMLRELGHRF